MGYREPEMALTQARRRWTSGGKIIAILSVFGLLLIGCGKGSSPVTKRLQAAPVDPWLITNLDPKVETPALLWNGLIGIQIKPDGSGAGNTLFDITSYQPGGEEKIVGLPNPLAGEWSVNYETLKPGDDYKAVLDTSRGALFISWSQVVKQQEVKFESVLQVDPKQRIIRQVWRISAPNNLPVWFHQDHVKQTTQVKEDIYAVYPLELAGIDGQLRFFATEWSPDQLTIDNNRLSWKAAVWKGQVYAERIITLAPKGQLLPKQNSDVSRQLDDWLVNRPQPIVSSTEPDIKIDGPVEDQQFIRSALFYLRNSISPQGKMSVSPMGLSSDIYNGHVFWDADIWVFPALALIDPERAAAIPKYRLAKLKQAEENFYRWCVDGMPRPTSLGAKPIGAHSGKFHGAKFPWESSVTGKETVPGPSRFQDHITGSVAWSVSQACALTLVDEQEGQNVIAKANSFFQSRSNRQGGLREILDTMSPDEHHTGDNDLYTNLLAMWVTNGGKWPDKPTYKLPADDKSFLTYDNDGLRGYKQAAAVLSIYPLQYPPAEKQARVMMNRFSDKVTKNGPAMTDSIHSIIWSRLGEKDKAYKTWHDSWKPFVKPPFLLFSEKRNSSRTYFTTGAAGSLQAVLYGFAGIRIGSKKAPNSQWSMPLKNGQILSVAPNLPKEWNKLTLRNLTILDKKYTFEIAEDKVKVTEER